MEPSGNTTIDVPALRGVEPRVNKIVATASVSFLRALKYSINSRFIAHSTFPQ